MSMESSTAVVFYVVALSQSVVMTTLCQTHKWSATNIHSMLVLQQEIATTTSPSQFAPIKIRSLYYTKSISIEHEFKRNTVSA